MMEGVDGTETPSTGFAVPDGAGGEIRISGGDDFAWSFRDTSLGVRPSNMSNNDEGSQAGTTLPTLEDSALPAVGTFAEARASYNAAESSGAASGGKFGNLADGRVPRGVDASPGTACNEEAD